MASQGHSTHELALEESEEEEETTNNKTTSSPTLLHPPELEVPALSLCSQLGEAIGKPGSPLTTPSPEGSAAIKEILQRLELMEMESRGLLSRLLSMVQTDARLQSYITRRLHDCRLSSMWGLVEQMLAAHQGSFDVDDMLNGSQDKDLKEGESGPTDVGANERFKVRQFDMDHGSDLDQQPPPSQN